MCGKADCCKPLCLMYTSYEDIEYWWLFLFQMLAQVSHLGRHGCSKLTHVGAGSWFAFAKGSPCDSQSQTLGVLGAKHHLPARCQSTKAQMKLKHGDEIEILGEKYITDDWTSVSPRVLDKIGKNLHNRHHHPLGLIRQRIQNYFYKTYVNRVGNPIYSVYDNFSPAVTIHKNFNSLLIPKNHPSWSKSETYFINQSHLLRAHTSAHQEQLIRSGLDAFLVVGDVYRRDEIDSTHYPVFHQIEGVRLFTEAEVSIYFMLSLSHCPPCEQWCHMTT